MKKQIKFDADAQASIITGINVVAKAVAKTLGPRGANVILDDGLSYNFTKDGISVAKSIELPNRAEDVGAQIARAAAAATVADAGDGTSTSVIMLDAICQIASKHLQAKSVDLMSLRRGLRVASDIVVKYIADSAIPVRDEQDVARVATISANNNAKIGNMIAGVLKDVTFEGSVSIVDAPGSKTQVVVQRGYTMSSGSPREYLPQYSAAFNESVNVDASFTAKDKRLSQDSFAAYVWCVRGKLNHISQFSEEFEQLINLLHSNQVPLIIFADAIEGEAQKFLVSNIQAVGLNVVFVPVPGVSEAERVSVLEDIAAFTGATIRQTHLGKKLLGSFSISELGIVQSATINTTSTILLPSKLNVQTITERLKKISAELKLADEDTVKMKLKKRASMMATGIATIYVGGQSMAEVKEQTDLIEDALLAARAAHREGIVAGGGTTLLRAHALLKSLPFEELTADEKVGVLIMQQALLIPLQTIVRNGGGSDQVIIAEVLKNESKNFGYDAKNEKYVDCIEEGIIDPAAVLRCVITNATTYAEQVLSTSAYVGPEDNK